jgi:hypothetical protein
VCGGRGIYGPVEWPYGVGVSGVGAICNLPVNHTNPNRGASRMPEFPPRIVGFRGRAAAFQRAILKTERVEVFAS